MKVICIKRPSNDEEGYLKVLKIYTAISVDHSGWSGCEDNYINGIKYRKDSVFWIPNNEFDDCFKLIKGK